MILFTCVSMAVLHFESMNRKSYIMVIMNSLESSISGEMYCYGLLYTVLIFHRGRDGGYVLRIHVLVQFVPASGLSCLHLKNQVQN